MPETGTRNRWQVARLRLQKDSRGFQAREASCCYETMHKPTRSWEGVVRSCWAEPWSHSSILGSPYDKTSSLKYTSQVSADVRIPSALLTWSVDNRRLCANAHVSIAIGSFGEKRPQRTHDQSLKKICSNSSRRCEFYFVLTGFQPLIMEANTNKILLAKSTHDN